MYACRENVSGKSLAPPLCFGYLSSATLLGVTRRCSHDGVRWHSIELPNRVRAPSLMERGVLLAAWATFLHHVIY